MTSGADHPRGPGREATSLDAPWRVVVALAGVGLVVAVVNAAPEARRVAAAIVGGGLLGGHVAVGLAARRLAHARVIAAVWTTAVAAVLLGTPLWIGDVPIGWFALPVVASPVLAGSVAAVVAAVALAVAAGAGLVLAGVAAPAIPIAAIATVGVLTAAERRRGEARIDALHRREVELAGVRAELQEFRGRHDDREERLVTLVRANQTLKAEVEQGRRVLEQALDTSRTKTSFLLKVSHELRTPLNAIVGYTELLLEHQAEGRSELEQRADLERVLGSAHDLMAVIDNVLDLARIEAGKYEVELTSFELGELLQEAVAAAIPLAERGDNKLKLRLSRDLGVVCSDRTRLRQIVVQLLGNACKFTRGGQIELSAEPQATPTGPVYVLSVRDTGVGIDPAYLPRLFTPFSQADDSPTRRFGGLGVGLALCKHSCTLLGGEIAVESEPGKGSVFRVQIPATSRDPREAGISISVF